MVKTFKSHDVLEAWVRVRLNSASESWKQSSIDPSINLFLHKTTLVNTNNKPKKQRDGQSKSE
jgi:hypothetical protein